MRVIVPVAVTDATLVSASIPEDDHAAWNAGTTYAAQDRVIVPSVHAIFESAVDSNTGNDPLDDDGTKWVMVSATNRWRAFDKQIAVPAAAATDVTYTLESSKLVNGLTVHGVVGSTITLTVSNGVQSTVFTRSLVNRISTNGWHSFLFGGFERQSDVVFLDLPWYGPGSTYTVTVTAQDGVAEIGQIVFGRLIRIGGTRWEPEISIVSGSVRERDVYLNFILVKRATALRAQYRVVAQRNSVASIVKIMRDLETEPAVWIGDSDPKYGLIIYGLPFDYSHTVTRPNFTEYSLIVEGLK